MRAGTPSSTERRRRHRRLAAGGRHAGRHHPFSAPTAMAAPHSPASSSPGRLAHARSASPPRALRPGVERTDRRRRGADGDDHRLAYQPNPSMAGEPITVQFTVTSSAGTPTGLVTVADGNDTCTGTYRTATGAATSRSPPPGRPYAHRDVFRRRQRLRGQQRHQEPHGTGATDAGAGHVAAALVPGDLRHRLLRTASRSAQDGAGHDSRRWASHLRRDRRAAAGFFGERSRSSTDGQGHATFTDLAITGDPGPPRTFGSPPPGSRRDQRRRSTSRRPLRADSRPRSRRTPASISAGASSIDFSDRAAMPRARRSPGGRLWPGAGRSGNTITPSSTQSGPMGLPASASAPTATGTTQTISVTADGIALGMHR